MPNLQQVQTLLKGCLSTARIHRSPLGRKARSAEAILRVWCNNQQATKTMIFFFQWEYIYTYILGLVMVDPWGSIVSKQEMFWEILGWSYFVFVVVSQLPTKDTVGILQMISRSFPECNSEWSNHIALECACFFVSMGTPPGVGWDPNDCLLPPFQWNLNFK